MTTDVAGLVEAIDRRISCRAFDSLNLSHHAVEVLHAEVQDACDESGLRFVLHVFETDGSLLFLSPKMFAGRPPAYVSCVGPDDPIVREKIGYYGERIVLRATELGLGSCWVAGTFDRKQTTCEVPEGMKFHDVIPLGTPMANMPFKQRSIRKAIRAKSKRPAKLYHGPTSLDAAPRWVRAGIDAVCKAPSAINEQPVVFVQDALGSPVHAALPHVRHGLEHTDLGIAKLHFELAAGAQGAPGWWEWGADGIYVLD
ncbi:MAG: nitroreductase family protein [Coriobacteriales bacterium]|nr:nitroreductase family protein [Coriobacteriales bacterium]